MDEVTYSALGSVYDPNRSGTRFALFSSIAQRVEVCVFDTQGAEYRHPLAERKGDIWYGFVPNIGHGTQYGYRVYCERQNINGTHLLLDPYAKAVSTIQYPTLLSIVVDENYDWQNDRSPNIAWGNTIIYEAHVKGLTQLHPDIPEALLGTYAGLSHPVMIDYLSKLGITTIELLPVQYHLDEPRLQQLGLKNYWGYNVIAPFAVDDKYWSQRAGTTPINEFKDMVKALHRAGIEVILDVVFNHTAELDDEGPVFSLKEIDRQSYYWLDHNDKLVNCTGCGNTLKFMQPNTIQWLMDCLRYWITEFHIDGFRFDLGSVLARTPNFSENAPLLCAMLQDPLLKSVKLITEPWDIGEGGYQLGEFPYPFAEWNDVYRDTMRRFWLHNDVTLGQFAQQFAASSLIFDQKGKKPSSSINFITSHDGFTLNDLVSFNNKHNEANGENNRDGHNQNWTYNFGYEGNNAPKDILSKRLNAQKNLLTTLLLSQGTPMLLAGDEWGNSQFGNNNSYCQDNEIGWLNWQDKNRELLDHVTSIIQLRKQISTLTQDNWWQTDVDVCWLNNNGIALSNEEWQSHNAIMLITLAKRWIIIINATHQEQTICYTDITQKNSVNSSVIMENERHRMNINAMTISILTID